jgi:hypothetical protein
MPAAPPVMIHTLSFKRMNFSIFLEFANQNRSALETMISLHRRGYKTVTKWVVFEGNFTNLK